MQSSTILSWEEPLLLETCLIKESNCCTALKPHGLFVNTVLVCGITPVITVICASLLSLS